VNRQAGRLVIHGVAKLRPVEAPVAPRHVYRAVALVLVGLLAAGCSLAPQYTYISDSADKAYFKVPPSWHQVNESSLQSAEGTSSQEGSYLWSEAYDASSQPSVDHVFSATEKPVAYASVISLSSDERNDISFNSMRDLLLPVTSEARKAAADDHESLSGFASLSDQVITNSSNDRGIREIFDYDLGVTPETFDLTVMTNAATTKLYFLLVQCAATCFSTNYPEISQVVNSFTVGGS
jgi:hypothetical protein